MDKTQIQVLLIEDNPSDVILLRDALENDALTTFELTAVERLISAVKVLSERSFDIILLDLGLPDSQGLETFNRIHQVAPHIPKVILSGFTDENLAMRAVQAGAQDYLVKGAAGFSSTTRAIRYAIERNNGQQQLRESEERFRYLFDNNPHPMWAYDLKTLEFLAVNDAAVDKYGYTRDEFLHMTIADIRPNEDMERLKKHLELPRPSLQHSGEWRHKLKDGTLIDVDISSHALKLSGRETALVVAQDITERRRAEVAVRASEERFRAMIENGLDDISLLDAEGKLIWESPAVVRNLGYPENAFVGQNIFEIVHPDDKAWTTALYAKLIQSPGSRQEGTFRLQHSDGSWHWVEAIVSNMLDNPSVQAIVVNYRDITERQQAQETIRRNEETLAQAGKMAHLGAWEIEVGNVEDLNNNPLRWSDEVYRIFGYEPGTLEVTNDLFFSHIHPDDQQKVQMAVSKAITKKNSYHIEHRIIRSDGVERIVEEHANLVFDKSGKLVQLLGAIQDITERKEAEATIRRLAKFPDENPNPILRIRENGQITYANPASRPWLDAWKLTLNDSLPKEWQALVTDAYQRDTKQGFDISIQDRTYAITIAPFREEGYANIYGRDITERKQAEEKLHASEARYRLATLATRDVIWEWSPDTGQLTWAENAENVFGYRPEEIGPTDKWWDEHIHPEDRERVISKLTAVVDGSESIWLDEYRFLLKDSTYAYISDHGYVERDISGKAIRIIGAMSNITESKQAEEKLHASEERYRKLIENFPNGSVTVYDRDLRVTFVAGGELKQSNTQPQDFLGKKFQELAPAETFAVAEPFLRAAFQGKDGTYETPYWGDQHYFVSVAPIHKADGQVDEIQVISQNITDRKRAEDALRESEALYRQAIEVAGAVPYYQSYYDNGKSIKYEFIGEGIRQITGYGPEEFNAKLWDSLVEEVNLVEDLAGYSLDDGIQRVRSGESPVWKCEHRIRDRAGKIHWVFEAAVELRDAHGVAHGSIGTYQDITERKQAEEKLRESEARFASIFHTNPTRVSITSLEDGRFLDVNESFLASTGYSREEVLGHTSVEFNDWVTPQDRTRLRTLLEEQGSVQNFETQLRKKSGEILDILISAELVQLFGQRCILSVGLDITERKRAEQELRENAADLVLVNHLNETINRRESLTTLIRVLEREFKEQFNTKGAALYLLSEDGKTLNMPGISLPRELAEKIEKLIGRPIPSIQIPVKPDGLFHKLLNTPQGTITTDPREIQQWIAEIAETNSLPASFKPIIQKLIPQIYRLLHIKSVISLPLTLEGKTIGVLDISSSHLLNAHDLERFQRIGGQLSAAILRHQDEQKLRESNERFEQLANNIEEAFWITAANSREEIYLSPATEKIWGKSVNALMNPNSFLENVYPEDQHAVEAALHKQNQGEKTAVEYRILQPDGSVRWIWDRAFPIFDDAGKVVRLAGIAADITQRKQADEALRESEERFRSLFDRMLDGVYRSSHSGKFLDVNPAMVRMFGYSSREEMLNVDIKNELYFAPDERGSHILDTGMEETDIYRMRRKDGSEIWVEDHGSYVHDEDGEIRYHEGILRDITEHKKAEIETHRHLAELEALYENGLAVGRLLDQNEIGELIIATFARHLSWHHVAIRLIEPERDEIRLVAFNQEGLSAAEIQDEAHHLNSTISNVGQGLSGWVVQTGQTLRTGNVHDHPQYVTTYPNIQSGLYMPLKIGKTVIGVISVESEAPDAFSEQDERLLATLANQAAIAFENARLYQSIQQELQERKRAETALRTSETHYRELADSITDIFFELDQNLHYSHWNKASEILTGVPEEEAIGKSMREIFGDSDEQVRMGEIYESVLVKHQPRTFETLFILNNQPRNFEVNAYPSTRGVAVVAKDVTERKRSETIMQKRFELMEYAAQHSLEEIMEMTIAEVSNLAGSAFGFFHIMEADQTTPSLQIWSVNALSLFNVPVSEGRHRSVEQAGVWADAVRQRRAVIHNDYASLSNKKDLPTGHAAIARELVIPIIRNEKILAVLGIANKPDEYNRQDLELVERFVDYAWDITERKQMALALADERNQLAVRVEERTADLSRANANLARALRVKDEFLANMSHELRTPLNAILGLSESLAEQTAGSLNDKQLKYLHTISESGHHLLSLINDILDLAKIEAGQITLDINSVNVVALSDAILRMIKQLARKKDLDVSVTIDEDVKVIWADERRLKQMVVNLLSNAVKFTPEGGKLGLEVHGDQDENKVMFTVWDTGIGISDNDLPRLFQPFVQLDSGLSRESSGTGLGLALVTQMARLHGGSIQVTSQPGKGSRFTITLPWKGTMAVDPVERLKITGKFRALNFANDNKPTILLIEDTEEVIMMLSDYLEINGFKVVAARDGVEGLAQAELTHPDLILMDVQMPIMDGFETTKKLRSKPEFRHTPIIALTALAMPNDRKHCLAVGMDEHISKPVPLNRLLKIIHNFLTKGRGTNPQ